MTLDSLPDLDTSGLCLVKTLSTALTCWPFRNMALRDGARTSTRTSSVAKGRAGLELAVGFPHLVELPFQTALGRPGFAERPLTFFPLGAELLSLLLKLLHCVGHVDLDGEHIRFGHCADILHRSPLFPAGRLGGS